MTAFMHAATDQPADTRRHLLDRKGPVGALALVAMVVITALSAAKYLQLDRIAGFSGELRALEAAEGRLNEIESSVLAMQSSRRGFALTGSEDQALHFEAAVAVTARSFEQLHAALASRGDAARLRPEVAAVQGLVRDYEAQLRASMAALRQPQPDPAVQPRLTFEGQAKFEQILSRLRALELSLERDFGAEVGALAGSLNLAQRLEMLLFAGATLGLASALGLAWRQAGRRERVLAELAEARAGLEREVGRRTADLDLALRRYRNLVELSEDVIMLCGADRCIQYANPAALSLLSGLQFDEVIGHPLLSLVAPAQRATLEISLQALDRGGPRMGFTTTTLAGRSGKVCPVELAAAAIPYGEGGAHQMLVVVHDLRQRLERESAMRDQLEFIDRLVETLPLPVSSFDANGRFTRVNRAFERFHGVDRGVVLGRLPAEVLAPAQAANLLAADVTESETGLSEHESTWHAADGHERVVQVRRQRLSGSDGLPLGMLAVQTDISALRAHEGELRLRGERLSELASQLIAAQESERRHVARELHDQVGQILTALHLQLATCAAAGNVPSLAGPIELTEEALRHTRDLTASLHPHVLDDLGLKAALNWLLKRYILPSLGEVEFVCELVPERAEPAIELVAFRVVQEALTNVVRHAKATCAEVHLRTGDGWLHVDVSDDGEGFTSGDTWGASARATSLGVTGMRERVEDMGGECDIESAPNMGTRLRVLLPWPQLSSTARGIHAHTAGR